MYVLKLVHIFKKEKWMRKMSFSKIGQNLATAIDIVVNNHSPIIITRQNKEPVVMMITNQ